MTGENDPDNASPIPATSGDNREWVIQSYVVCIVDLWGQSQRLKGWETLPRDGRPTPQIIKAFGETVGAVRNFREMFEHFFERFSIINLTDQELGRLTPEQREQFLRMREAVRTTQQFSDTFVFYAPVDNSFGDRTGAALYSVLGAAAMGFWRVSLGKFRLGARSPWAPGQRSIRATSTGQPSLRRPTPQIIKAFGETVGAVRNFREMFEHFFERFSIINLTDQELGRLTPEQREQFLRMREAVRTTQQFSDTFVFYAPVDNSFGDRTGAALYSVLGAAAMGFWRVSLGKFRLGARRRRTRRRYLLLQETTANG